MRSVRSFAFLVSAALLCLPLLPRLTHADNGDLSELLGEGYNVASLNELTQSPETLNKVTLLHLGKHSQPVRLKLLSEAQNYLFITVPYWFDDEEGNLFLNALKAKKAAFHAQGREFDARVMVDWTSPASNGDVFAQKMYKKVFEATGGRTLQWNRIWAMRPWSLEVMKNRIHDKLFVVDGKKLIMGGMNIADEYLKGGLTAEGWHDTDVLIEGAAAQQATRNFLKPYLLQRYLDKGSNLFPTVGMMQNKVLRELFQDDNGHPWFRGEGIFQSFHETLNIPLENYERSQVYFPDLPHDPAATVPVRLIYTNPLVDKKPGNGEQYNKFMNTLDFILPMAKHSLRIFAPYLTTTDRMNNLLINAARRGLKVQIITNSIKSSDMGVVDYKASLPNFLKLMKEGVEIHEWQGHQDLIAFKAEKGCAAQPYWPGKTLHTKAVIIDGSLAFIGSNNMNVRSELENSEVMAMIRDTDFARQLDSVFEYDLDKLEDSPEGRTLDCNGHLIAGRPRRTLQTTMEYLRQEFHKHGLWLRFLHLFQPIM